VKAAARIEIAHHDGRDVVVDMRSDPPIAIRRSGERVLMIGSAAGPVGGDEIDIDLVVGPGARASVGSVAATSVWPGPAGEQSTSRVVVRVGSRAQLCWWPEPTVSIAGSNHCATMRVHLAGDACCTLLDELSLGRSGQRSGVLQVELRVERGGKPLVHHTERFGPYEPGTGSAVGVGDARHVISGIVVGPPSGDPATIVDAHAQAAWLPVAADAAMLLIVAADRPSAHRLLATIGPSMLVPEISMR
jgi:urease accessory protein